MDAVLFLSGAKKDVPILHCLCVTVYSAMCLLSRCNVCTDSRLFEIRDLSAKKRERRRKKWGGER